MIEATKKVTGEMTEWFIKGHAVSRVCNGYSALAWTFVNVLAGKVQDLKYRIERKDRIIDYEYGDTKVMDGNGTDSTYICYRGSSVYEDYFLEGIRLLAESYPEEVAPLQVTTE